MYTVNLVVMIYIDLAKAKGKAPVGKRPLQIHLELSLQSIKN